MNYVLIAVLAIIAGNIFVGIKKGLVQMVFCTLSFIVAVIITNIAAPYAAQLVCDNTSWDESISKSISESFENAVEIPEAMQTVMNDANIYGNQAADKIAGIIITTVTYTVLFAIIMTILRLIGSTLKIVNRIPIVRGVNRLAGGVIGAVEGLFIVWMCFVVIMIIGSTPAGRYVYEQIESSAILSFLCDKNIILNAFVKFCF